MNRFLICALVVTVGGACSAWAQTPSLSLSGGSGAPGANVSVVVSFVSNGAPATGLQWTMNYSTGDFSSVTTAASATATASGEVLSCSKGVGQVTCLMINLGSSAAHVPSGQIAVATFQISATTRSRSSAVELSGLSASSGVATSLGLTGIGSTITITSAGGGLSLAGSMAQIASGGGWETTLTFVNIGAATAEARLNFFGNNGSPPQLPFTFPQAPPTNPLVVSTLDRTLNSNALLVLDSQQPSKANAQIGSAQLWSNGTVGGFAIFKYTTTGQEAVVPLETVSAPSYVLAFDNTGALATGVAIANVAAQPANIPVIIRDDTGTEIGTASIILPAQGHTSFMLAGNYGVTEGKRGSLELNTPPSGQICALGLRANRSALTTLPLLTNAAAGSGSMAHVASGGGWQTTFTLVNAGLSSVEAQLSFFDNNGSPLALPLKFVQSGATMTAPAVSQTIAAGATLTIQTEGSYVGASVVGSAQLTTAGNISGFAIFRYDPTGQEAVVPLETRNASAYMLAFDNTNGVATGLALANVSNQAASVPLVVRDDTGKTLGTPTISLAAHGHASFVLTDRYSFAAGKRGTVEFETPAGLQISVLGLRGTAGGAVTTIPVLAK
jgi:hypothetical protein